MSFMSSLGASIHGAPKGQFKVQQLVQSKKEKPAIIQKEWNEVGVLTGPMSYCASAILLFSKGIADEPVWSHMQGHHASGGSPNINFTALFKGVLSSPNNLLFIVEGTHPWGSCESDVREALAALGQNPELIFRKHIPNALITKYGVLYDWDKITIKDKKEFDVYTDAEQKTLFSM